MPRPIPMLTQRAVLLAKIESEDNLDANPTASSDAILSSGPVFGVDPVTRQRDFVKQDISPSQTIVGRVRANVSFNIEIRGNGAQNDGATAPRLGRLLRACGFAQTAYTDGAVGSVKKHINYSGPATTWASDLFGTFTEGSGYAWESASGGTNEYYLTASGGGDPGVAEPDSLFRNGVAMTKGSAIGSLSDQEWQYGDNDTLGFNTIYVREAQVSGPDNADVHIGLKSSNPDIILPYRIQVVAAGASGTAKLRVTGGVPDVDESVCPSEHFAAAVTSEDAGATISIDGSDPLFPVLTVGGSFQIGDVLEWTICGVEFRHTVSSSDTNMSGLQDAIAAEIDATDYFNASDSSGTISITMKTETDFSISSGSSSDDVTATLFGTTYTYSPSGSEDQDTRGAGLAAVINASANHVTAAYSGGTVTITYRNGVGAHGVTVTSGTTGILLGDSGYYLIPTWSGSLILGDTWDTIVHPSGFKFSPVSQDFETVTLYLYYEGKLHKVRGAKGNMQFNAQSGQFGTMSFTFEGAYDPPESAAMPTDASYEQTVPPSIELAQFQWDYYTKLVIDNVSFNLNNDIVPRPDLNSQSGFIGTRIAGRNPQGNFDPEALSPHHRNIFNQMKNNDVSIMVGRFGQSRGNTIWLYSNSAQVSGATYGDRNGIRTYQGEISFTRNEGNDEIELYFT